MTNKEAIETIKIAMAEVEWDYPMDYTVAFEAAVDALEKQIPKKPNYVPDYDTCVYYHWECPECGNYYGHSIKKGIRALYGNSAVYCSRCGQCLDWEGIDDE